MIFLNLIVVKGLGKTAGKVSGLLRIAVLISVFTILNGCANPEGRKTVELRDGRKVAVFFEIAETAAGDRIFVADFRNDNRIRKEITAEREVFDIWKEMSREADRLQIEEGLIHYRYSTGKRKREGTMIYELLLFSADRTETGRWAIRRVN